MKYSTTEQRTQAFGIFERASQKENFSRIRRLVDQAICVEQSTAMARLATAQSEESRVSEFHARGFLRFRNIVLQDVFNWAHSSEKVQEATT
jgi:hypothetical protein